MNKEGLNKEFGKYIKFLRAENGLSQKDLATLMDNNYQNISALERGEYSPSLFYLYKLSAAFKTEFSDFMVGFSKHLSSDQ